jgi:acetyl coenzyme A synthetase (ADP forming)-like protein
MSPETESLEKYNAVVILRDGSTLSLRAIRPDDENNIISLAMRLSERTLRLRFGGAVDKLSVEDVKAFYNVDYYNSFALVATTRENMEERIIAVGRYNRLPSGDTAEVAFVVEDAYQDKGIGTHLLEQLAIIARENGINFFQSNLLADNTLMMDVVRNSGYQIAERQDKGNTALLLDISPTEESERKADERERNAMIASLKAFLEPRSVAVIGASRKPGTIGNKLFYNILRDGFTGVVYPVNPNARAVASVKAYPTVLDIPDELDLAVVIVPAEMVQQVVEQCGRKGVHGIVVISSGFAEGGPEGIAKQRKLVETVLSYRLRLIGPNCMGLINSDPKISLNATFSPVFPPSGRIAFCTQSGALGLAILEYAQNLNLGLSTFVSTGNLADVSNYDLIQYWEEDPATDIILLYVESFGHTRKFARVARRITATKPIVAVKSGRSPAGLRAAASHTGALASAEVAIEALFAQTGIIRVDTLEDLFDVANLLSHQPIPRGNKVAILTNGGGPGIMTADACATRGLEVPPLSEKTKSGLRSILRREASVVNPIDMTAEASANDYSQALKLLAADDNIDIVIIIFIPPIVTEPEAVAGAIREVAPEFRQKGKTLVASFMGSRSSFQLGSPEEGYVPSFAFPEATATALVKATEYNNWLRRPKGNVPQLAGTNKRQAAEIIKKALGKKKAKSLWLDTDSITGLLDAYGIRTVQSRSTFTAEDAVKAATEIGFPVAVKLLSETITHKTEVGGVILNLRNPQEVVDAFNQIKARLVNIGKQQEMQGVTVQQMISEGVEVIVGVTQEPSFGSLLLFGLGGTYTELFKDVVVRIHPLTDVDAQEMVRSVKAYRFLEGWRGAPPADIKAIEELLLRVSAMVEDIPQIAELDFNPVKSLTQGKGYVVVDARILLT